MTIKDCDKVLNCMVIKSIKDMEFALTWIQEDAQQKNDKAANAYSSALYYITTGRLSGSCVYAIKDNLRDICKTLNRMGDKSPESIGEYLKSFSA